MNDAIRMNTLKVLQNDEEDSGFRKLCAYLGVQRSAYTRQLINEQVSAHVRRRGDKRERPRHGHVAQCPGKAGVAGGFRVMRH